MSNSGSDDFEDEWAEPRPVEYTWLIEVSDDGESWAQPTSLAHIRILTTGIEEPAAGTEELAVTVLDRLLGGLHAEQHFDWEDLWFRSLVWDHAALAADRPVHDQLWLPEHGGVNDLTYGPHLRSLRLTPHAVRVLTPLQAHRAVWTLAATT